MQNSRRENASRRLPLRTSIPETPLKIKDFSEKEKNANSIKIDVLLWYG